MTGAPVRFPRRIPSRPVRGSPRSSGSTSRSRTVHPLRRAGGRCRRHQAVARCRPDALARRGSATGEQRGRRQQLRDAGARQADPHLRCSGRPRRPDPGALARAGERPETLDHLVRELTPDTLIIADPEGPIGIAGVMGGAQSRSAPRPATSSSSRPSSTRSASGGPRFATPSDQRRAFGSRRARSTGSPSSVPTGRLGSSASGPAAR